MKFYETIRHISRTAIYLRINRISNIHDKLLGTKLNLKGANKIIIQTIINTVYQFMIINCVLAFLSIILIIIPELVVIFTRNIRTPFHCRMEDHEFISYALDFISGQGFMNNYPFSIGYYGNTFVETSDDSWYFTINGRKTMYLISTFVSYIFVAIYLLSKINNKFLNVVSEKTAYSFIMPLFLNSFSFKSYAATNKETAMQNFTHLCKKVKSNYAKLCNYYETVTSFIIMVRIVNWVLWSIIILFSIWITITLSNISQKKSNQGKFVDQLYKVFPSLYLVVVNFFIIGCNYFSIRYEKYSSSVEISILIIRIGCFKLLLSFVSVFLGLVISPENENCYCILNFVGNRLYSIMLAEIICQWLELLLTLLFLKCFGSNMKSFLFMNEESIIISISFIQTVIILAFPYNPWLSIIGILHTLLFIPTLLIFSDKVIIAKSIVSSNHLTLAITSLLWIASIITSFISFYFNMLRHPLHSCGHFRKLDYLNNVWDHIVNMLRDKHPKIYFVMSIILSYEFFVSTSTVLCMTMAILIITCVFLSVRYNALKLTLLNITTNLNNHHNRALRKSYYKKTIF